jgi:hypothetical protein
MLFRGTLRSLSYQAGANRFLQVRGILLKDFVSFAQECTEELAEHAQRVAEEAGRPYLYRNSSRERKEDVAREIAERDGVREGLICVLYAVEPCMGFDIYRNRQEKKLQLVSRQRKCRFFYFYYLDREFGLMHVRVQSWFPFEVHVCLNGRSYLACQLDREGIPYERRRNCFTAIGDLPRAQALLAQLDRRAWAKTLAVFAGRVNPLLGTRLQGVFPYYWSLRQSEVATDVLFRDSATLDEVYPRLWQHAMAHFSPKDILAFLGKRLTAATAGEVTSHVVRRPEGLRLKHESEHNSIKVYNKEGSVLRVETTINNPRWFRVLGRSSRQSNAPLAWRPMRLGVSDTERRADVSRAANARYLDALAVVGDETPSHRILDSVSQPVKKDGHRYRALRPVSPEEAALFEAILRGEHHLHGFSNRQIRALLFPQHPLDPVTTQKRSALLSRRLRLLRAHGLIRKVPGRNLYRPTPKGHGVMTTALLFRRTDVQLLRAKGAA